MTDCLDCGLDRDNINHVQSGNLFTKSLFSFDISDGGVV